MNYTEGFKAKMVQRMLPPDAMSAMRLSREIGVSQSQLSRWLRDARSVVSVGKQSESERGRVVEGTSKTAAEKVRMVMAAAAIAPSELGAFLRREGVHEAELAEWREAVVASAQSALEGGTAKSPSRGAESKRIKELEREVRRKDKALAEAAALLVLQKKVRAIWGDADDDTDEEKEK